MIYWNNSVSRNHSSRQILFFCACCIAIKNTSTCRWTLKCPVCDQLGDKRKVVKTIQSYATGEEVEIRGNLTCRSTNVIYCITCRKGGPSCPAHPQYIGETGKSLVEWFRGHRGTVAQKGQDQTTASVGVHFRQPGHSIHDLEMVPIEKVRKEDCLLRKTRESYYIGRFNTVNKGLNKKS